MRVRGAIFQANVMSVDGHIIPKDIMQAAVDEVQHRLDKREILAHDDCDKTVGVSCAVRINEDNIVQAEVELKDPSIEGMILAKRSYSIGSPRVCKELSTPESKYKMCCICGQLLPPQALVKCENVSTAPDYLNGQYVCRSEKQCELRSKDKTHD